MEYTEKDQAIDMYLEGKSRREIAEIMGKPLRTIQWWTEGEVSALAMQITCLECGKKKRTLNIQKRYCSTRCKNRADYHRRLKRTNAVRGSLVNPLTCQHCGEPYQPAHLNSKRYCTPECRNNASIARRLNRREVTVKEASQSQAHADKAEFDRCLEVLWQARKDNMDFKIDKSKYGSECATIEAYYNQHQRNISSSVYTRVQTIFDSMQ